MLHAGRCFAKNRFALWPGFFGCVSSSFSQPTPTPMTMISYLLNALSTVASTASGTPGNAVESHRGGDVSPRVRNRCRR